MNLLCRTMALFGSFLMVSLLVSLLPGSTSRAAERSQAPDGATAINPHGDLVFRVTNTKFCSDCHGPSKAKGANPTVLDNEVVRSLKAKGKGAHGPGRFADCFRCHAGGRLGVEKYGQRAP